MHLLTDKDFSELALINYLSRAERDKQHGMSKEDSIRQAADDAWKMIELCDISRSLAYPTLNQRLQSGLPSPWLLASQIRQPDISTSLVLLPRDAPPQKDLKCVVSTRKTCEEIAFYSLSQTFIVHDQSRHWFRGIRSEQQGGKP